MISRRMSATLIGAGLVGASVSCARAPSENLDTARVALLQAEQAEAPFYAQTQWMEAQEALQSPLCQHP